MHFGGLSRRLISAASIAVMVLLSAPTGVQAYTATEYTVSSDTSWMVGQAVALDSEGKMTHASVAETNFMGVVTRVNDNSIEVASSGTIGLLVSDQAGEPVVGENAYLSSVAGVASTGATGLSPIGVIQKLPLQWQEVSLEDGGDGASIRIGEASVQLLEQGAGSIEAANPFLATMQRIGNGVAGESVDLWRIITALAIGAGGLVLSFGLLFISSRESFFSMGRNPMAGTMIMRGLWKMIALSVVIMCVSLGAAYAIVRAG